MVSCLTLQPYENGCQFYRAWQVKYFSNFMFNWSSGKKNIAPHHWLSLNHSQGEMNVACRIYDHITNVYHRYRGSTSPPAELERCMLWNMDFTTLKSSATELSIGLHLKSAHSYGFDFVGHQVFKVLFLVWKRERRFCASVVSNDTCGFRLRRFRWL